MTTENEGQKNEVTKTNLAAALIKAQSEFPKIDFDAEVKVRTKSGGEYSFRYATLAHIFTLIKPVLSANGLGITQHLTQEGINTSLIHESGESICSTCPYGHAGQTEQEWGSMITYRRRYSVVSLLGLVAEDDDDANISAQNSFASGASTPPPRPENKPLSQPAPTTRGKAPASAPASKGWKDIQGCISEKQAKRLLAIGKKAGCSRDTIKAYMAELSIEHMNEIKRGEEYDSICAWAERGGQDEPSTDEHGDAYDGNEDDVKMSNF